MPFTSESMIRQFPTSLALREHVAKHTEKTVILSFSAGKDSIASWLSLRDHFDHIVPYYLYLVPDLEFVEEGLRYFEDKWGEKIHRFPNTSLLRLLNNLVFQPPEHCLPIEEANLKEVSHSYFSRRVRELVGAPDAFTAVGVRAADSPMRRMSIKKHGPINYRKEVFYPVFDWKLDDVIGALKREGVKLPIDYKLFGRTFDGIDARFLRPIRDNFPRDYQRILEWFPLADLMLFREERIRP